MRRFQAPKGIKWLFIVTTTVVATFIISTTYASASYSNKILPNTFLLGKNIGNMTYEQATQYFEKNPPFVSGTINFELNNDIKSASPAQLGIAVDVNASVKTALAQNKIYHTPIVTPRGITGFLGQKVRLRPSFSIEQETFSSKIRELYKGTEKDPVSATIVADGDKITVKNDEKGEKIDTGSARTELLSYLPYNQIPRIKLTLVQEEAKVKAADLAESKEYLAAHISGAIKMVYGYRAVATADLPTIVSWLSQDELAKKNIKINTDALQQWLNDNVVAKVARKSTPRLVSANNENEVLQEGAPGKTVDEKKLAGDVEKIIKENSQERQVTVATKDVEPETRKVSPGYTLGRYSGKYIEIDLSQQMLYQIEGNNVVGSHRVSTGKWSMPTPQGEFAINGKTGRAYSATYDLYMPYWMSFVGSQYGIHELPEWANGTKEGEGHLGTPVSHGCVRLGVGDAAAVYNWADIGTPVIIH